MKEVASKIESLEKELEAVKKEMQKYLQFAIFCFIYNQLFFTHISPVTY